MRIRFWGTRGSIATPGPQTNRFGGNTSCVEAQTDSGQRFIFDCGTGARLLGMHMMAHDPKPIHATILLSHTHWDHIQGFPFFTPLFVPGGQITVCGPSNAHNTLPETLAGQMEYTYFPVTLADLGARIQYQDLAEGEHIISGVRVKTQLLNHPAITLGYRIEADGVSVVYLCDHEPYWESLWRSDAPAGKLESILHSGDRRHAEFLKDADVVIHDAQYTPEEYPSKKNWGHSTYRYVTQIAAAASVKHLFLTHHDPTHDDAFLERVEDLARQIARDAGSTMEVHCAREGLEATYRGTLPDTDAKPMAALSKAVRPPCILIVDDDEDLRMLARMTLARGGSVILEAEDGDQGIEALRSDLPDLVLLDLLMPGTSGMEVLKWIRENAETRNLPVVVLTAQGDEESVRKCFELGATDYLMKPFTAPQLDARVRSSLTRAEPKT